MKDNYKYTNEANYHAILEYLVSHPNPKDQSFRKIEKATGVPKSTIAEIISERGNLRKGTSEYWEKFAEKNPKLWDRIKNKIKPLGKTGDVQYYGFISSKFQELLKYAARNGYRVKRLERGLSVIKTDPSSTLKAFQEDVKGIEHDPYASDDWEYWGRPDKISIRKLAELDKELKPIKEFKIPDEITLEDTYANPDNYELLQKHLEQQETKGLIDIILQIDDVAQQVDTIFTFMNEQDISYKKVGGLLFEEWKRINDDKDGSIFFAVLDSLQG